MYVSIKKNIGYINSAKKKNAAENPGIGKAFFFNQNLFYRSTLIHLFQRYRVGHQHELEKQESFLFMQTGHRNDV